MADIEINKSDIDEVNDVIQETDEEAYALDSEFTEEKEYKTVQKYELVTILSYLIGVRNEILDHMYSIFFQKISFHFVLDLISKVQIQKKISFNYKAQKLKFN